MLMLMLLFLLLCYVCIEITVSDNLKLLIWYDFNVKNIENYLNFLEQN